MTSIIAQIDELLDIFKSKVDTWICPNVKCQNKSDFNVAKCEKCGENNPYLQVKKPQIFFVVGGTGCGKTTQCRKLMNEFKIQHFSTGDVLRKERDSGSKYAEIIANAIKQVKLIPTEITVNIIKKAIETSMNNDGMYSFVIDGIPRSIDNLNGWNKLMNDIVDVKFLLYIQCTPDEMIKRVLSRSRDKLDTPAHIKKRFEQFKNTTLPVIKEFIKLNKCKQIQSIGSADQTYQNIRTLFAPYLDKR